MTSMPVKSPAALNPEQPALTQPWKNMLSRGLIEKIEVSFTPLGTSIAFTLAAHVPVPDGTSREKLAPGVARQLIADSGLDNPKKQKATKPNEQPQPLRSLTELDAKDDKNMVSRIAAVAAKIGNTAACGRIGSLKLFKDGVTDIESWWKVASNTERVQLLTQEKYFKQMSTESINTLGAAAAKNCPFRGSVPTPSKEEEPAAPKKETKPSTPPKAPKGANGRAK